jgi:hypothetical protein
MDNGTPEYFLNRSGELLEALLVQSVLGEDLLGAEILSEEYL